MRKTAASTICTARFPAPTACRTSRAANSTQLDRDGSPLKESAADLGRPDRQGRHAAGDPGADRASAEQAVRHRRSAKASTRRSSVITRDLWHLFYQNQMQIDGGKNDKFVAYADSGALVMGHYDGSQAADVERREEIHARRQFLHGRVRRLVPQSPLARSAPACRYYPDADKSPAKGIIAVVEADGVSLTWRRTRRNRRWTARRNSSTDGKLTPDFYAVNTMQPPYQPSANQAGAERRSRASPIRAMPNTLPPQT